MRAAYDFDRTTCVDGQGVGEFRPSHSSKLAAPRTFGGRNDGSGLDFMLIAGGQGTDAVRVCLLEH